MKKIISIFLLCALVLSLAGCHKASPLTAFHAPESFNETEQYTISFWAKNDTNQAQVAIYNQAIADFQALYPNIRVELKLYNDYGDIYNDVITNLATNTTPNVCITYPDHIATYMAGSNVVVPLDDLFANEKYGFGGTELKYDGPALEEMVPQFLNECAFDGSHYAIPYMRSTEACYINKTYVEKLGYTLPEQLTWDFIWEVSEAAMAKDANGNFLVNGQNTMIPFIYKSTDNMMIQMLRQKGADYSDPAGQVLLFNDTTKELLYDIGEHSSNRAFNTFKSVGYPANYLNMGQCIFMVDSTAGATWVGHEAPLLEDNLKDKVVPYETVLMAIPQFDTEHPQMISQGPSICIFNKEDPQEVLASWLFAQFMLTNKVQIAYSQTEGYLPVTTKATETEEYQTYLQNRGADKNKHYFLKVDATKLLMENIENTFVTSVFNGSASLRNAAGELIEETKRAGRRGATIDDAFMEELFEKMSAQYHLDQIIPDPTKIASGDMLALPRNVNGPLPAEAVILLAALGITWLSIGIYCFFQWRKKKISSQNH